MDIDQISNPLFQKPNQKWKRQFSKEHDAGFLWFAETSWHYINPRGILQILKFLMEIPKAYIKFRNSM